ncbi:MAG: histidine kinase [Lewinellaceae bacterium]|nr:histidine kinase [Lewinellaceae bacterium]
MHAGQTDYRILILGAGCFFFALFSLHAQQPHPFFRQYTTDDGLANNVVFNIIEDKDGYIWFSTANGLCRFNGYEMEQFPSGQKDINYTALFNMQLDSLGRVWVHSIYGKLFYFDRDSIYKHPFADTIVLSNKPRFRYSGGFVLKGSGERAFYFLDGLGIVAVDTGGRQQLIRPEVTPSVIAMEQDGIFATANVIHPDADTRLAQADSLEKAGMRPPVVLYREDSMTTIEGFAQRAPSQGRLEAMIRYSGGILAFRKGEIYFIKDGQIQWQQPYPHNVILFRQDREGRLMAGLNGRGGVLFYENLEALRKDKFSRYLDGHSVTAMCQGRNGGYWFTTLGDGVFYTPGFGLEIFDEASGLPQEIVRAIAMKSEEQLYIGFDDGAVYFLDMAADTLINLGTPSPRKQLFDLEYDASRDELWAATDRLYRYQNGKWFSYEEQILMPRQPYSTTPKNIAFSPDGQILWFNGSTGFGALGIDSGELLYHSSAYNEQQRCYAVFQDNRGRIWASVNNQMFELVNGKMETRHEWHEGFKYPVQDIVQLDDNALVFAPNAMGLLVMHEQDSIRQLTSADGLVSDAINCLYAGPGGNIWAGSFRGLSHLTPKAGGGFTIKNTTRANGLPSNAIYKVAGAGNSIWLATEKGAVRLKEASRSAEVAAPLIVSATANDEPWDWKQKVAFGHRQNNIGFEFISLQYHFFGKVPYRYRLEKNAAWARTYNRDVFFPALKPGSYQLEVQAQGKNGAWSPSALAFFEIRPPYWATWWFRGLVLALLGSAAIGFFRFRTRQLKAEANRIQERAALEQEMAELKQSALRAQMNPHFIFNCLSSIQNFILEGDKEQAVQYLSSFARLIRAALHASMEAEVPLEDEANMLERYLELEQLRFQHKFDYSIEIDEQVDTYDTAIPPLLLQPYVENAIVHGLADKEQGGKIEVHFFRTNGSLMATITDNGMGISASLKQKKARDSLHKSVGMTITRKRLGLLSGQPGNPVLVEELKGEDGAIAGTRISVTLMHNNIQE